MGYIPNPYKIFRGTTANDKTGSPARTAGEGINKNTDDFNNALEEIDNNAEKKSNKATGFSVINDVLFPTVKAVRDWVEAKLLPVKNDITFHETRIGEIEGLGLFADQANQKIIVRNASGDLISELSVAFLNNEGTTFFYNETTEKLELQNDAGAVLSAIPVSAFVSNIANSIGLNGSKLSLKDTEGNELSFVTFGISNISGLQTALNSYQPESDKVYNLDSPNNNDYPSTLAITKYGFPNPFTEGANDLNNLTKPGYYFYYSSAPNLPSGAGSGVVYSTILGAYYTQTYYRQRGGTIAFRSSTDSGTTWGAWDILETTTGSQSKADAAQTAAIAHSDANRTDLEGFIDAVEEDVIIHEQRITDLELNPPIRVVSQAEYDALGDVSVDPTIYMIKNA